FAPLNWPLVVELVGLDSHAVAVAFNVHPKTGLAIGPAGEDVTRGLAQPKGVAQAPADGDNEGGDGRTRARVLWPEQPVDELVPAVVPTVVLDLGRVV